MTTQIQRRRGTTVQHSSFTGAEAEITIDTDKETVVVHDGSTAGGFPLAKEASPAFTGDVSIPDKIVHTGDTNTAIRFPSADTITAETGGSERLRIDSSGSVKIGSGSTITPDANADDFVIDKGAADTGLSILSTTTGRIYFGDAADDEAGSIRYTHSDNALRFETASTEAMRIDSSGRLLVNTSTARTDVSTTAHLQLEGTDMATSAFSIVRNSNDSGRPSLVFGKTRGTSTGAVTSQQR